MFDHLAQEWKSHRSISSSIIDITRHPAYQGIIGMEDKAIPQILRQIKLEKDDPSHWFWALYAITGEQPIDHKDRGNTIAMARAWLEWGKANGYET